MNILSANLHPIVVHFPIALLTLYCVFEFISWGQLRRSHAWSFTKAILVTLGGIGLLVARQFGDIAKNTLADKSLLPLVHQHETYANWSTAIFGIIAAAYVVVLIKLYLDAHPQFSGWKSLLSFLFAIQHFLTETPIAQLLALAGLVVLTITGALGGSIVYGSNNDPFTKFIYVHFFRG